MSAIHQGTGEANPLSAAPGEPPKIRTEILPQAQARGVPIAHACPPGPEVINALTCKTVLNCAHNSEPRELWARDWGELGRAKF